jgi:NADPH:quinone reductase-like Zn-dependent oxidoreductase
MKAVSFARFGLASEVAELAELPEPGPPAAGDALVEIEAAPINPSDLLHFAGRYGAVPPALPAFAGGGVVGRVLAVGADVVQPKVGERVLLVATQRNSWRQRLLWPAAKLVVLPEADPVDLALLSANPPTALLMLQHFVTLKPGDWVIQNAANSSVGVSLIQIARSMGVKTINLVRRDSLVEHLRGFGADVTLVDGPELRERVAAVIKGGQVRLGIDAVAGSATRRLANCVADGGTVVNYGLLSGAPCEMDAADVVFRDVSLRGFWYSRWMGQAQPAVVRALFDQLVGMLKAGTMRVPVEATYLLGEIRAALAHAEREGRMGKVVLLPNA